MKFELTLGTLLSIALIVVAFVFGSHVEKPGPLTTTPALTNGSTLALTPAEIAKHRTRQDCWMTIDGIVYNITGYLSSHPGGISVVLPGCGKDATELFATKAGRGSHSSVAYADLVPLELGPLNGSSTPSVVTETLNAGAALPSSGLEGGEDE